MTRRHCGPELGLPDMVVGIDESRRQYLVCAVDDFRVRPARQLLADPRDLVTLNQKIRILQRRHMVILPVAEDRTIFQQNEPVVMFSLK